jgi:hypothetical protein
MKSLPEQYRLPAIAIGILLIAVAFALLAGQQAKSPVSGQNPAPQTATTTPAANATGTAKTTTTAKKPAPKPSAPTQSSSNPSAVGQAPTFVSDQLKLSVLVSSYGADLTWTPSYNKLVTAYVIVKSTTDPNPYYPKENWTSFHSAITGNYTWEDRYIQAGALTYYRVCALLSDDTTLCGNVASALKP